MGPCPPTGQLQSGKLYLPSNTAQHGQDCFRIQRGEDFFIYVAWRGFPILSPAVYKDRASLPLCILSDFHPSESINDVSVI